MCVFKVCATMYERKRKKRERDVNQNAYVSSDDLLQSEINTHRTDRFRLYKSVKTRSKIYHIHSVTSLLEEPQDSEEMR